MTTNSTLSGDELKQAAIRALGYSDRVVNFDPLNDPSTIPEMMTFLRDNERVDHMGGQSQLWWSSMFNAWVVTWKFRGDDYETMRQGASINEALCNAVVAAAEAPTP